MKKKFLELKKDLLIASLIIGTSITGINTNKINTYAQNNNEITINNNRLDDKDEIISYYCKVFSLDEKVINNKLREITKNFRSPGWQHGYCINDVFYDDKEKAILNAIRDIYYNPSNYDLDDSIRTDKIYETNMEIEEMIYKYANLFDINKEVALSIVYCECGTDVNSHNYLKNNNPAGIGPNMHFLNKEVGVIYFCNMLKNNYNCNKDSNEEFLGRIASTYCEIPDHWLSLTLPNYYKLKDNYLYFVSDEDKNKYDISSYDDNKLILK